MKFHLLMFILYVNVNYSQCQSTEYELKKIGKTFPKKVRLGLLQFNNAGKYVKPGTKYDKSIKTPNRGVDGSLKNYTVFPKPFPGAGQELVIDQIVPDSLYFPVDTPLPSERRSRVKKVLPTYVARVKRSTDDKKENKSNRNTGIKKNKASRSAKNSKSLGSNNAKKVKSHDHKKQQDLSQLNNRNRTLSKIRNQKTSNGHLHHTSERKPRPKAVKNKSKANGSVPRKLKNVKNNTPKNISRAESVRSAKKKPVKSRKGPDARRLIAGRDALIEEYPYVVSIQKDKQHWCSGAILNQKMVITTANCMWRSKSISRMRVRAGSRHTDRGGQLVRIQEVMKHPGWKVRRDPDNDIAMVLVDQNIRFSHAVHSVDLPNRVMMPAFDDAWITSWGAERRDGVFDPHDGMTLQVYHARLLERDKCNNVTQRFGVTVTENFICLAQTGRRAPCTRDTGAPAVSDGVLWGMASWGIRKLCGTERFPAMFSYLASQSNMDFVVNATHYLMSDDRHYPFLDRYPVPRYPLTTPTPMTMPY